MSDPERPAPLAPPISWGLTPYQPSETVCVCCNHSRVRHDAAKGWRCGLTTCRCICFTTANPS